MTMTRREALIFILIAVAMIAAGLTGLYGPWGLVGTGLFTLAGVLFLVNEREEDKPDA
jgi:hypothetical protein